MYAPIAQLDRASDYGSEGLRFDSLWAHHYTQVVVHFYQMVIDKLIF